jgi:chromosome segregation ATPase
MQNSTLTYGRVAAAANALIESGSDATVEGVRALLGTGSRFLIRQLLARWQTEEGGRERPALVQEGDAAAEPSALERAGRVLAAAVKDETEGLLDSLSRAVGELNEVQVEATARWEGEAESLRGELKATRDALSKTGEAVERIQRRLTRLESALKERKAREEDAGARLASLEQASAETLARLDAMASASDAAGSDVAARLTSLEQDNAQIQSRLDAMGSARDAASTDIAARLAGLEARTQALEAQVENPSAAAKAKKGKR